MAGYDFFMFYIDKINIYLTSADNCSNICICEQQK